MTEKTTKIYFRGDEEYSWMLKEQAVKRRMSQQAMLEQAVELYLSIPPDKLDEVRLFVSQWQPEKKPRKQKEA